MTRAILLTCLALSTLALSGGYGVAAHPLVAALSLAAGGGWWLVEWRSGKDRAAAVGLAALTLLAGWGILNHAAPPLMIIAAGLALAAWDLARFRQRLTLAEPAGFQARLERHHLRRLLCVCAAGIGLAELALGLRLRIGFAVIIVSGVLVLAAMFRLPTLALRLTREQTERP